MREIDSLYSNWDATLDSIWEFMREPAKQAVEADRLSCAGS
jgi:hypothetical protein